MTLLLGARCVDGVVLAADHRLTGLNPGYGKKITGELTGVLTGFAGDRGNFVAFTTFMKKYVDDHLKSKKENVFETPYSSINNLIWEINRTKSELGYSSKFDVLMAVSGAYFRDKKSQLHHFLETGGIIPINQGYVAVGTGKTHGSYFLKRSFRENMNMKMDEFAQLADLVIRFVSDNDLADGEVGLDKKYPYPQIVCIPDKPTGELDHELTEPELKHLKKTSNIKLKTLYDLQF